MAKSKLRLVSPTNENRTVTPRRRPNAELRTREHLTEREVERLIEAARQNRYGHRDATMILLAYRHGLRASELVRPSLGPGGLQSGRPARPQSQTGHACDAPPDRTGNASPSRCVDLAGLGSRALATYLDGTTTSFECSHMGHSKVRRSNPGASGTIRATTICVPHPGPISDLAKSKPRHP